MSPGLQLGFTRPCSTIWSHRRNPRTYWVCVLETLLALWWSRQGPSRLGATCCVNVTGLTSVGRHQSRARVCVPVLHHCPRCVRFAGSVICRPKALIENTNPLCFVLIKFFSLLCFGVDLRGGRFGMFFSSLSPPTPFCGAAMCVG